MPADHTLAIGVIREKAISRPEAVVQLSWLQRLKLAETQTGDLSADGIRTQARI